MRPRYLILAGPKPISDALLERRLRTLLPTIHAGIGFTLFTNASTPVLALPAIDGAIVGRLFGRDGRSRRRDVERPDQLAIESSSGMHLLTASSGSYVSVWHERGQLCLLRDPSATLPALYARHGARFIIASDPDLIWATGLCAASIDWEGLAHTLRFPLLPAKQTCLSGISAVQPGQYLRFGAVVEANQLWKPWQFATTARRVDQETQRKALANAVDSVVAGWADCFDHVSLELSGGLDSSILAASLAGTPTPWSGVNFVADAADGDERAYARLVAGQFGVSLDEIMAGPECVDPLSLPVRLTPRPAGAGFLRGIDHLMTDAADRAGGGAIFSGTGGDNVFCSILSTAPILDALASSGWTQATHTARDVAAVTSTTMGDVGWHLAKRWLSGLVRGRRWIPNDDFLAPDVRPRAHVHPWLDLPRGVAPGTRAHISGLIRIHPILDTHDRSANRTMIYPLLSQPVMEACLAIPSWQWIVGGRNRSVARAAFAGRLPDPVLHRRGKSRLDTILMRAFDRARPSLRELLCDGRLAAAGLLDRNAIDTALGSPVSANSRHPQRLVDLADAELWVRLVRSRQSGKPQMDSPSR